jgi:uncharacterized protein (DUF2342 family)
MTKKPAARLDDALAALEAIPNAVERWRAASDMTEAVRLATPRVAQVRQQVVRELRAQGMTYRAVGELLGIHFTRVKQLESGGPAVRWKPGAAKSADVEEVAAEDTAG